MTSITRLFVGNLPEDTEKNDLQNAFSCFGKVTSLDIKQKSLEDNKKNFAFVTLSSTLGNIESCIRHFSSESFNGQKIYVTRARESFLERLEREREEAKAAEAQKIKNESTTSKNNKPIKLGQKLNPQKRQTIDFHNDAFKETTKGRNEQNKNINKPISKSPLGTLQEEGGNNVTHPIHTKKDSDMKRLESLKLKRQEFKEKQKIIQNGLIEIDKTPQKNRKIKFSDEDEVTITSVNQQPAKKAKTTKNLNIFDDIDDSEDEEVNFEIKNHLEGKKGQKVLDLQARYKSDKRFVLDERFVEDDSEKEGETENVDDNDKIDAIQVDEKAKQLNILQDVLGVVIRSSSEQNSNKKSKMGMLRFDPAQPNHAKFLAPVENNIESTKKSKKKKAKETTEETVDVQKPEVPKVEVSKEQFYKVSDTLKEAIAQPTTFSLRSLFSKNEEETNTGVTENNEEYIPILPPKAPKIKNPLDRGEKNPFKYDSSDSEDDEKIIENPSQTENIVVKAVWRENLFFSSSDPRLKEGLAFFNKNNENEKLKERRELKSLMKRRIYNKDRKNQMFQKKIGGRKKTMKKSYKRKS